MSEKSSAIFSLFLWSMRDQIAQLVHGAQLDGNIRPQRSKPSTQALAHRRREDADTHVQLVQADLWSLPF